MHVAAMALALQRVFTDNSVITSAYFTRSPTVVENANYLNVICTMISVVVDIQNLVDMVFRRGDRAGPVVRHIQPIVRNC